MLLGVSAPLLLGRGSNRFSSLLLSVAEIDAMRAVRGEPDKKPVGPTGEQCAAAHYKPL